VSIDSIGHIIDKTNINHLFKQTRRFMNMTTPSDVDTMVVVACCENCKRYYNYGCTRQGMCSLELFASQYQNNMKSAETQLATKREIAKKAHEAVDSATASFFEMRMYATMAIERLQNAKAEAKAKADADAKAKADADAKAKADADAKAKADADAKVIDELLKQMEMINLFKKFHKFKSTDDFMTAIDKCTTVGELYKRIKDEADTTIKTTNQSTSQKACYSTGCPRNASYHLMINGREIADYCNIHVGMNSNTCKTMFKADSVSIEPIC